MPLSFAHFNHVNTFAHFNHVILNLVASRCVADHASATELAMGYWQAQLQLHAQALAGLRPRTRSFYLVSPAPMDLFVRRKGEHITRPLPAAAVAGLMTSAPTAAHENRTKKKTCIITICTQR